MIKNINEITCNKNEIDEGIKFFLENKNFKKKDLVKNSPIHLKKIIFNIKKLVDRLLISTETEFSINGFRDTILKALKETGNISDYGMFIKLSEIYGKKELINNSEYILKNEILEYYELLEKSPLILFNGNLKERFEIKRISKNIVNLTGYNHNEFLNGEVFLNSIIYKGDTERVNGEIKKYIQELKLGEFEQKYKIITKNGELKEVYSKIFVKYNNGEIENLFGFIYDINQNKKFEGKSEYYEEYLECILNYDEKSGLPNKYKLYNDIKEKGIQHLIIFEIINFNKINLLFGIELGNIIFKKIIKEYKNLTNIFFELNSTLYRLSTTEFGITFNPGKFININQNEIILELNKFLENINIEFNGINFNFLHNIGASFFCEGGDLLYQAKIALEESKNEINNEKIVIYTKGLLEKIYLEYKMYYSWISKIKLTIEKQLNNEEGNLKVYYQGILNNKTNKINKFESLIRYQDNETQSVLLPCNFLSYIKKGKLINKLTQIVIIDVIKKLKENPGIEISINFTLEDLKNKFLISLMYKEIELSGIDKSRITIEILEDIFIAESDILNTIKNLKNDGFKISIDDFGVGYSNFERIIKIKPDYIKIDGSLIKGILEDEEKFKIVETIVIMIHNIGAKAIAEFVDSNKIQEELKKIGVDYSQGYLFSESKPFLNFY